MQTIKTIYEKIRIPTAKLAGAFPSLLTAILIFCPDRFEYLDQHRDVIIQALGVSSLMIAAFCVALRKEIATLLAGLQTAVILAIFLVSDSSEDIVLGILIVAIIVGPLAILACTLGREIDQHMAKTKAIEPFASEDRNTCT